MGELMAGQENEWARNCLLGELEKSMQTPYLIQKLQTVSYRTRTLL